ncbi:FadR family transcriptional regulator [Pikeienuella piscinae]|uniref:FadR family transcriptional regulator n=1 Tax=Pikeienuella piscinae TaxID=2748098 RepID=A0A7L5C1M5_9RHOB|nr:FCD domain-containing protein [Pikeienuella piscinae]QIE56717.1 FadR family transcriptional regulator [Pikeienuella piscinae]
MADQLFDKLTVNPAYRVVAEAIERNIVTGRLKAGDRLPSEMELAKQFGVHRSTVREGIRLLEQSGLVTRSGRTTLEVTLPHFQVLATRASRALSMHDVSFRELWDASMLTEPAAAEAAVDLITSEEIDALRANIDAMAASVPDTEEFVRLDTEFHDLLAAASHNKVLMMMREPVSLLFLPAGRQILPRLKTYDRVVAAHEEILKAIIARDRKTVCEWMNRHMSDFRRAYVRTGLDLDAPMEMPEGAAMMQRSN